MVAAVARLLGLTLSLGMGLGLWYTPPRYGCECDRDLTPLERLLRAAAGPAATLGLFWLSGASLTVGLKLFLTWRYPVDSIASVVQVVSLASFLIPLVPMRYRSVGLNSDGMVILRAVRSMLLG